MKSKTEKTPEIRARELFKMVYGKYQQLEPYYENPTFRKGWIKLGKFVLDLEKKWTKAKNGRRVRGD